VGEGIELERETIGYNLFNLIIKLGKIRRMIREKNSFG
jgi:hypothetical protein